MEGMTAYVTTAVAMERAATGGAREEAVAAAMEAVMVMEGAREKEGREVAEEAKVEKVVV